MSCKHKFSIFRGGAFVGDISSQLNFLTCRVTGNIVALKEIRLNSAEGTPFTAIREGNMKYVM